jgi:stage III sporulation protein AA
VLVLSKTGAGKTTFIRDLCKNISNDNNNVVLIDERNEIAGKNQSFSFNVGDNTDVLTYSTKLYGFNQAIRTLNPSYVVTDELMSFSDAIGVYTAINSGVSVIATVHCDSVERLKNKEFMAVFIENKVFDYYVLIKIVNCTRKIEVYNKNFDYLCCI